MAEVHGSAHGVRRAPTRSEPSSWAVGWSNFTAVMLIVLGMWWVVSGLVAVLDEDFYVLAQEWRFRFDATTWGWTHMVLGVLLFSAGIGLTAGAVWARAVGVVVASFAMLAAFAWLPYHPVFASLFIALSIAVIWSLTVHGRDLAQEEAARASVRARGGRAP